MTHKIEQQTIRLGVISALPQEQKGLINAMTTPQVSHIAMRDYTAGTLWGIESVCVLSRLGKVAAAATAIMLIERFSVTHIIFTGVAGSADSAVQIGDIVVAESLVQHDMNAVPLFPRFEVPLTGKSAFQSDEGLNQLFIAAADDFIEHDFDKLVAIADRQEFRLTTPRQHHGMIASGDEFICGQARIAALKRDLPRLLAVEMEGAAVAQVCFEFERPFAVVRTISDKANEQASIDFVQFIEKVASVYAFHIIKRVCEALIKTLEDRDELIQT